MAVARCKAPDGELSESGQPPFPTVSSWRWLGRLLLVLPLAAFYVPVFADLGRAWARDQYAGHGMFVPPLGVVLAFHAWHRARAAAGGGDRAGLAVLGVALGLLFVGRSLESFLLQSLSASLAVAGAILWAAGWQCLRSLTFPVAFLALMAPPPSLLVAAVTRELQLFATRVAGVALDLVGVPFYQSGVVIVLPTMTLQVGEVCNGLRFLMALLVLTTAASYVTLDNPWRRAVLIASVIPIAILANAARVAAIAVAVQYVGPQAVTGELHHWIGKSVWVLTLVPLVGIGFWLRRRPRTADPARSDEAEP